MVLWGLLFLHFICLEPPSQNNLAWLVGIPTFIDSFIIKSSLSCLDPAHHHPPFPFRSQMRTVVKICHYVKIKLKNKKKDETISVLLFFFWEWKTAPAAYLFVGNVFYFTVKGCRSSRSSFMSYQRLTFSNFSRFLIIGFLFLSPALSTMTWSTSIAPGSVSHWANMLSLPTSACQVGQVECCDTRNVVVMLLMPKVKRENK